MTDLKSVFPGFDSQYCHMKTHRITVNEQDWKNSKYTTRNWEKRVNIVRWEHDFVDQEYRIDIEIK